MLYSEAMERLPYNWLLICNEALTHCVTMVIGEGKRARKGEGRKEASNVSKSNFLIIKRNETIDYWEVMMVHKACKVQASRYYFFFYFLLWGAEGTELKGKEAPVCLHLENEGYLDIRTVHNAYVNWLVPLLSHHWASAVRKWCK